MTKALAVIGANYGDEGKGVTTHYLCQAQKRIADYPLEAVVRFNGGPQAGHTVHHQNKKHVFSSYGSGTFAGVRTHLTKHMLFNPNAALAEYNALKKAGVLNPHLTVDPKAFIISPWDIALNQLLEVGRGDARHGSCGMGIGEAEMRRQTPKAPTLYAASLSNPHTIFAFCADSRDWFKKRVKEEAEKGSFTYLNEDQQKTLKELMMHPILLSVEMYQYAAFMENVKISDKIVASVSGKESLVVFEGAQGLLLDQDDPDHQPNVTWSKTGLANVVEQCVEDNIDLMEVCYVTRPYITRHGAGKMLAGIEATAGEKLWGKDYTNKENDFQGQLRYGHLDWTMLKSRIEKDLKTNLAGTNLNPAITVYVTCMDQVENSDSYLFVRREEFGPSRRLDMILTSKIKAEIEEILYPHVVHYIDGTKG